MSFPRISPLAGPHAASESQRFDGASSGLCHLLQSHSEHGGRGIRYVTVSASLSRLLLSGESLERSTRHSWPAWSVWQWRQCYIAATTTTAAAASRCHVASPECRLGRHLPHRAAPLRAQSGIGCHLQHASDQLQSRGRWSRRCCCRLQSGARFDVLRGKLDQPHVAMQLL